MEAGAVVADLGLYELLTLVIQTLTLIIVVAYVVASFQMARANANAVEEMRQARLSENRAYVTVHAEWDGLWELVVRNVGRTAARNVRLHPNRPLQLLEPSGELYFADSVIGQQGIPYMAPGQALRILMEVPRSLFEHLPSPDLVWRVSVQYEDDLTPRSPAHEEQQVVDLNIWGDIRSINRRGIHEAAKELEDVRRALQDIECAVKDEVGQLRIIANRSRGWGRLSRR